MDDSLTAAPTTDEKPQRRAREAVRTTLEMLRGRVQGLMEVLYGLRTFHTILDSRLGTFEWSDFRSFAHEPLARHSALYGLSFIPLIRKGERSSWETNATAVFGRPIHIAEIDAAGGLKPAQLRESYAPIAFIEPIERNAVALGFDLASESFRRQALDRARDTGEPCTTRPVRLVQEIADQMGCLVLLPLYRGAADSVEERRANLAGFVCAAFRIGDLVESVLRLGGRENVCVEVSVFDTSPEQKLIHRSQPPEWRDEAPITAAEWMEFAGARWCVMAQVPDRRDGASLETLPYNLAEAEEILIARAVEAAGGNISAAARLLGVHRVRIYRRAKAAESKIAG